MCFALCTGLRWLPIAGSRRDTARTWSGSSPGASRASGSPGRASGRVTGESGDPQPTIGASSATSAQTRGMRDNCGVTVQRLTRALRERSTMKTSWCREQRRRGLELQRTCRDSAYRFARQALRDGELAPHLSRSTRRCESPLRVAASPSERVARRRRREPKVCTAPTEPRIQHRRDTWPARLSSTSSSGGAVAASARDGSTIYGPRRWQAAARRGRRPDNCSRGRRRAAGPARADAAAPVAPTGSFTPRPLTAPTEKLASAEDTSIGSPLEALSATKSCHRGSRPFGPLRS